MLYLREKCVYIAESWEIKLKAKRKSLYLTTFPCKQTQCMEVQPHLVLTSMIKGGVSSASALSDMFLDVSENRSEHGNGKDNMTPDAISFSLI